MLEKFIKSSFSYSLSKLELTLHYENTKNAYDSIVSELNSESVEFNLCLYIITNYFNETSNGYIKLRINEYEILDREELILKIKFSTSYLTPKPINNIKIQNSFVYFSKENLDKFYSIKNIKDLFNYESEFCWFVGKSFNTHVDLILRKGKKKYPIFSFNRMCIINNYMPDGLFNRIYKDIMHGAYCELLNMKWFLHCIINSDTKEDFVRNLKLEAEAEPQRFKKFLLNYPIVEEE